MIPGKHNGNKESDAGRDDERPLDRIRPGETLRHNVEALDEREGSRDIRHRPLHQLALLQALQEFIHRAAAFSSPTGDCNSLWKRGSLRSGSHSGSNFRFATFKPAGTSRRWGRAAMAASVSPKRA